MIRQIIRIDEDKCNGCGLCAAACHEGAIGMRDGKAVLLRDDYCDGLGNCLPACPTGAISFEERDAAAYDEEAVRRHIESAAGKAPSMPDREADTARERHPGSGHACGCPGSRAMRIVPPGQAIRGPAGKTAGGNSRQEMEPASELSQWPVQIKLAPVNAPWFNGADLLVAADCTAYAYAAFHRDFIRGHVTLIGCPKLDETDYAEKLAAILSGNDVRSLTVVRMDVPCCGGLARAAEEALRASGKFIPWKIVTIGRDGSRTET